MLVEVCSNDPRSKRSGRSDLVVHSIPAMGDQLFSICCVGVSPLLMDRGNEHQYCACEHSWLKNPKSPMEKLQDKIYRDASGRPVLPVSVLESCLREAGRKVKVCKANISTAKTTKLFSFLELKELEIPLIFPEGCDPTSMRPSAGAENEGNLDPKSPWEVDVRRLVGAMLLRPKFEKWGFTCTVKIDFTTLDGLTEGHIRKLFDIAGNRVGLLLYRPACKGPFGRFKVDSIKTAYVT